MPGPTCAVSPSMVCLPVKTISGTPQVSPILQDRLRQGKAGRQGVRTRKETVGQQDAAIGADAKGLAQAVLGHRRPHGQHRHRAAEPIAQAQTFLQREQVVRVDDGGHSLAHDRVGNWMHADLRTVRYLLDANDDVHGHSFLHWCYGKDRAN